MSLNCCIYKKKNRIKYHTCAVREFQLLISKILLTLLTDPHLLYLISLLTHVSFFSSQQTPVFWEVEEVSKHLFFIISSHCLFSSGINAIKVALVRSSHIGTSTIYSSVGSWRTLISISPEVTLLTVAEHKSQNIAVQCNLVLCHTKRWSLL